MFLSESTDPRHVELEDVGMRGSGRGRGVIVTSARQVPQLFLDVPAHFEVVGLASAVFR